MASKSPGLNFFDDGGYNVESLKEVRRVLGHEAELEATNGNALVSVKWLKEPKASLTSKQQFQRSCADIGTYGRRNLQWLSQELPRLLSMQPCHYQFRGTMRFMYICVFNQRLTVSCSCFHVRRSYRSYYCAERECLLVYDFLPSPSLADAFHGSCRARLHWTARMQSALTVAKGLAYLHSQASLSGNGGGFVHGSLHFYIFLDGNEAVITGLPAEEKEN